MYKNTYVLVANSAKARLFRAESNNDLEEVETFIHPKSRIKSEDITTDKPGTTFDRMGPGRHHVGNEEDIKEEEAEEFARSLAHHLKDLDNQNVINQLFLIAAPRFLGYLQKSMNETLKKKVIGSLSKDLTTHKAGEIRPYLPLVL